MAAKHFIIFVVYFKLTNSQYSALNFYQPCYYSPTPTPPVLQPMYAASAFLPSTYPPTSFLQPPTFASLTPPYVTTCPTLPVFEPSTFTPPSLTIPTFAPPMFTPPSPARPTFALPAFAPMPTYPPISSQAPTYPLSMYASATRFAKTPIPKSEPVALPKYQTTPTIASSTPATTPKFAPVGSATSKCSPSTATACYLTTALPPSKPVFMKEKVKENLLEKLLPPPTYPCPLCTGFANVPKNLKISPPPCSSVLPGILDQIPTIAIPDELKIKDLSQTPAIKKCRKCRFDEDLLDGFLKGLGLGKSKN